MMHYETVYNAFRRRLSQEPTYREGNSGIAIIHDVYVEVYNRVTGYHNPVFIKVEVIVERSKRKGSPKRTFTLTTEAAIEAVVEKVVARCKAIDKENDEHDADRKVAEKQRKAREALGAKMRKALNKKGFDAIIENDSQGNVLRLNFGASDAQKVYDLLTGGGS